MTRFLPWIRSLTDSPKALEPRGPLAYQAAWAEDARRAGPGKPITHDQWLNDLGEWVRDFNEAGERKVPR